MTPENKRGSTHGQRKAATVAGERTTRLRRYPFLVFALCLSWALSSVESSAADKSARSLPAPEKAWTRDRHDAHALILIAHRTGVAPHVWRNFFRNLDRSRAAPKPPVPAETSPHCLEAFDDTWTARGRFLECLGQRGVHGLTDTLYADIYQARLERIRSADNNAEIQRSIATMSYVEDLIREKIRVIDRRDSQWYHHEKRRFVFYPEQTLPVRRERALLPGQRIAQEPFANHFSQFPFESGDIVLSVGGTSISTLIPLTTSPQRRYAHVFIVGRKPGEPLRVMESIIEKGVVGSDEPGFRSQSYHGLAVLRMKKNLPDVSPQQRQDIIRLATRLAQTQVERRAPYNMSMDMSRDDALGFFCSHLVAWAYAKAAMIVLDGKGMEDPVPESRLRQLVPAFATALSPEVFRFLNTLGVNSEEMPSPGDLMASDFIEIVADFRATNALLEFWTKFLVAHTFIERLNLGYTLIPPRNLTVKTIRGSSWFKRHILDFGLIPDAIAGQALVNIYTYDRKVFGPVTSEIMSSYDPHSSLLDHPPWTIRGHASHIMSGNRRVARHLRRPR